MERRLLTFIVASTAFFFAYITLRTMFGPPPKLPAEAPGIEQAAVVDDAGVVKEIVPGVDAVPDEDAEVDAVPDRPKRAAWVSLGSMDPTTGHVMLITLSNLGGGLERIELTERDENDRLKYRRVDVRNGYMGYIAGEATAGGRGVRVNVVGPGTPISLAMPRSAGRAALRGLRPGDVIVAVANRAVATPEDIEQALLETEPGDQVIVEVTRETASGDEAVVGDGESPADASPMTLEYIVELTEHPLDLVRLANTGGADEIEGNLSRLSCLLTLAQVNRRSVAAGGSSIAGLNDPATLWWNVTETKQDGAESAEFSVEMSAAEMEAVGGQPVRLNRSYTLRPGSYAIEMDIQIDNLHDEPQQLAYRLEGVNGVTLEGWWYSNKISPNNLGGAAARDVVYKTAADGHELISGFTLLKKARNTPKDPAQTIFAPDGSEAQRQLHYVGVDAQYFTVAYLPPEDGSSMTSYRRASAGVVADPSAIESSKERAVNTSFSLESEAAEVPANGSLRQEMRIFAGPKQPELLAQYGLGDCIYYGWFAPAARLLANLLHLLSGVGNYAVAIVLLTVIVRGAMFPLSRKAAINAQRMQELAPEMKKIAEKYKDDMEGRMRAQRELQQRVGFNPMAGCLPMFLQLPIFIGLYRALSVDIELRQAAVSPSLQWGSNLAGPDMLYYWGDWLWEYLSGRGTGWLGPYFNILPVIVVGLFLIQQKLFMPPATDEQQAMTQKVMNVMTLMMGLFFFRVPAGLCIYFITSSLWGICERVLVKKTLPQQKHFDPLVLEGTATPVEGAHKAKPTLADMVRRKLNPPEEPVERPNKRRRPTVNKKKR